jgi:hypothetical protein
MDFMLIAQLILLVIAIVVAIYAARYSSKVDKRFWEIVEQIKQMEREEKEWENQKRKQ